MSAKITRLKYDLCIDEGSQLLWRTRRINPILEIRTIIWLYV
jgi:hypothetical protein